MKLFRIVIALCVSIMTVAPLAAQTVSEEKTSDFYYVSVPLEKVFPYRLGYMVYYRKGVTDMARAYLPGEWFSDTGGKGDLIKLDPGNAWPTLTVFYKDGAFSHVRLYVRRERTHETWGNVPFGVNLDSYFKDVNDFKLEF